MSLAHTTLERGFQVLTLGALRKRSFQVGLIACTLDGDRAKPKTSQLSRHSNPFPASLCLNGPLMLHEECKGLKKLN